MGSRSQCLGGAPHRQRADPRACRRLCVLRPPALTTRAVLADGRKERSPCCRRRRGRLPKARRPAWRHPWQSRACCPLAGRSRWELQGREAACSLGVPQTCCTLPLRTRQPRCALPRYPTPALARQRSCLPINPPASSAHPPTPNPQPHPPLAGAQAHLLAGGAAAEQDPAGAVPGAHRQHAQRRAQPAAGRLPGGAHGRLLCAGGGPDADRAGTHVGVRHGGPRGGLATRVWSAGAAGAHSCRWAAPQACAPHAGTPAYPPCRLWW